MRSDVHHIDMQVLAYGFAEAGNHSENADGTSKRSIVGKDFAASCRYQIAAGRRIGAIAGNHGFHLAEKFNLASYHVCRNNLSARRIDTEHNRFNGRIGTHLGDGLRKLFSHDITAFAHDLSISIDNGNLVFGRAFFQVINIIGKTHRLHALGFRGTKQPAKIIFHLIAVLEPVHQPLFKPGLRGAEFETVHPCVQIFNTDASRLCNFLGDGAPDRSQHCFVLFPVFGRNIVTDIHFPGRFEFSVTDELHLYAKSIQKVFQERLCAGQSVQAAASLGMQEDAVRSRCYIIRGIAHGCAICHYRLSCCTHSLDIFTYFFA